MLHSIWSYGPPLLQAPLGSFEFQSCGYDAQANLVAEFMICVDLGGTLIVYGLNYLGIYLFFAPYAFTLASIVTQNITFAFGVRRSRITTVKVMQHAGTDLTQDPLLQGPFACEISGNCKLIRSPLSHKSSRSFESSIFDTYTT